MKRIIASGILSATLAFAGCGGPESSPPPELTAMIQSTQYAVDDFVTMAKQKPKAAPEQLDILLESLEARASEHKGGFATVRDEALALKALYEKSAPKAEIDAQLDKLKETAMALGSNPE